MEKIKNNITFIVTFMVFFTMTMATPLFAEAKAGSGSCINAIVNVFNGWKGFIRLDGKPFKIKALPAPESIFLKLKVKNLKIGGSIATVPLAPKINQLLNLDEKSGLYFEEVENGSRGIIGDLKYDEKLSQGIVGITESDRINLMLNYVTGYFIISKYPIWEEAKRMMRGFLAVEKNLTYSAETRKTAGSFRRWVGSILDEYAYEINSADYSGKISRIEPEIQELTQKLEAIKKQAKLFKRSVVSL